MSSERNLSAVAPILLTANGGTEGQLTLATTLGLFVKQIVTLQAPLLPPLNVQIKYVISNTKVLVGTIGLPLNHRVDVSAYTVAQGSFLYAAAQPKAVISMEERLYASYIQEPSNSWRVTPVDSFGNSIDSTNPLPVAFDGDVTIGVVEVKGTNGNFIEPNTDGSLNVNVVEAPITGQTVKSIFNQVTNVANGVETSIVTYVVPLGKTAILQRISTSGENVGTYNVYLNGTPFDIQRTYYGGDMNASFEYTGSSASGLMLNAGDTMIVKILHTRVYVGNFNGRIQVLEIS